MRRRARNLAIALVLGSAAVTAVALADDFGDVHADYQPDGQVTPCRFTRAQLVNARQGAEEYNAYGQFVSFIAEVDSEIARWDSGGCDGVAPPPTSTDPSVDFGAVFADWRGDSAITPCRFTRQQLQNALDEAGKLTDVDAYAPGFRDAVRRALKDRCAGVAGVSVGSLRITRIKARAKKKTREFVTIRNVSGAAIRLSGVTLRDKAGHRIRLPRAQRLRRGRKLRVITGCLAGEKKPSRLGGRFFACKRRQLWNDKGDVVKIVSGRRTVIAQRGYKRFRFVPRF